MPFDGFIAFAGGILQALKIDDLDFASGVFDQPRLLQGMGYERDAGPLHAQHLSKKLLREKQRIAAGQIPRPKQPAGKASVRVMRSYAGSRLLRLRGDCLFVPDQLRQKRLALHGSTSKVVEAAHHRIPGKLHNRPAE